MLRTRNAAEPRHLGVPSVPRAERPVPVIPPWSPVRTVPRPRSAEIASERQQAPIGIGRRDETRRRQPLRVLHSGSSSRGPSASRCPHAVQPLLMPLPEKMGRLQRVQLRHSAGSSSPAPAERSPTCTGVSAAPGPAVRRGGTVPAGALPREPPEHRVPAPSLAAMETVG